MHELLTQYPVTLAIRVAWGDMDANQHVNNVIYFRYLESARIAYFEQLAIADFVGNRSIGPILHSVNCRFRLPVTYPDTILAGTRITQIGQDRFQMEQCLVSEQYQKVAAQSQALIVTFDYNQQRKVQLPPAVMARIKAVEQTVGNAVAEMHDGPTGKRLSDSPG